MSENRCPCGGLRHKHDIEKIAALESSLAQVQADVEALRVVVVAYNFLVANWTLTNGKKFGIMVSDS